MNSLFGIKDTKSQALSTTTSHFQKVTKREENDAISLPHEKIEARRKKQIKNSTNNNKSKLPSMDGIFSILKRGESSLSNNSSEIPTSSARTQKESDKIKKKGANNVKANSNNEDTEEDQDAENLNNKSMISLRKAKNLKTHSSLSIYSPKICPICMESYHTDEEIAWSMNEECPHAFHLDCIMAWLMENSKCPMCRSDFLMRVDSDGNAIDHI